MVTKMICFLNLRHSGTLFGVFPHLISINVPFSSYPLKLNMWSSWVKRNGITQVMYIAKLNDGSKRAKKTFSMILERVFEIV
jgi:hypothetical protein